MGEQCGKELLGPRQLSVAVTQSATEEAGFRLDGEIGMILQVPAWLDFEGKGVHPIRTVLFVNSSFSQRKDST